MAPKKLSTVSLAAQIARETGSRPVAARSDCSAVRQTGSPNRRALPFRPSKLGEDQGSTLDTSLVAPRTRTEIVSTENT